MPLTSYHHGPDVGILQDFNDRCGLRLESVLHGNKPTKGKAVFNIFPRIICIRVSHNDCSAITPHQSKCNLQLCCQATYTYEILSHAHRSPPFSPLDPFRLVPGHLHSAMADSNDPQTILRQGPQGPLEVIWHCNKGLVDK